MNKEAKACFAIKSELLNPYFIPLNWEAAHSNTLTIFLRDIFWDGDTMYVIFFIGGHFQFTVTWA